MKAASRPVLVLVLALVMAAVIFAQRLARQRATELRVPVGKSPGAVVVADMNEDGRPDILAGNMESGTATLLVGDSAGNFREAENSPFAVGPNPQDIAVADFNHDGHSDLAFANHETSNVTVLLGSGEGRFRAAPGSPVPVRSNPHVHTVAAVDLNRDAHVDIVVDSWADDGIEVVFGDGRGGFRTPGQWQHAGKIRHLPRLRATDLDRDGIPDLLTVNPVENVVQVLVNDGTGSFPAPARMLLAVPKWPFFASAGDINGDERDDIVVAHHTGNANVLEADGVSVLLASAQGRVTFSPGKQYEAGSAPINVALGDINGDKIADTAVVNQLSDTVTIFHGGRSGLRKAETIETGRQPFGIALADLNGDGRADLIVSNMGDNDLYIRQSDGRTAGRRGKN
jgi:hypothetical protein